MDLDLLEQFWARHGWLMVLSPGTNAQQDWCRAQFGYCHINRRGDHSVMLFQEDEHRTRYALVWGTGEGKTTPWHPV